MSTRDVIVIGAGHNGLVAAARLADEGRSVVLLERSDVLGGLATGDEFHPGFTSVGPLHETGCVRDAVVETLDLAAHGLVRTTPAPVFVPQADDAGPGLRLSEDPADVATEIAAHSSADAERHAEYRAFIERIRPVTSELFDREPPALTGASASLWSLAGRGLALRRLGRRDMMELLRIGPMCVADWVGEWFQTELLRCAVAAPALDGTRSGPWSPGSAANLLRLETLQGCAVQGGAAALIAALEAAARQRGVDIRLGTEVKDIRVENGAIAGVTLQGGETIDSPVVAASCDPRRVFLDLLRPDAITPTLAHHIEKLRASGAAAKVDLALQGPLRFACRPDLTVERARIVSTIDDMERAFDATKYGRASDEPMLDVIVPTVTDPSLAPPDHHVVSILVHFAPYDLAGGWTDDARARLGDTVVSTLARSAPDLESQIVARRVLTPVDIEARYGVTGGHLHHAEHALDQMIVRPAPECARHATPIPGLFLCGSGSHPGGGLTGAPGMLGAAAVGEAPNR